MENRPPKFNPLIYCLAMGPTKPRQPRQLPG